MTQAFDAAVRAAETACLVAPDGGSPTEKECRMCIEAGRRALHAAFPEDMPVWFQKGWGNYAATWRSLRELILGDGA